MKCIPEKGFNNSFSQSVRVEYVPPKIYYIQTYLFLITDSIITGVDSIQSTQKVIRFLHPEKWNQSKNNTLRVINNV